MSPKGATDTARSSTGLPRRMMHQQEVASIRNQAHETAHGTCTEYTAAGYINVMPTFEPLPSYTSCDEVEEGPGHKAIAATWLRGRRSGKIL